MMDLRQLYRIIHNLDIREPLRRYYPQNAIVAINKDGKIVAVEKFKNQPTSIQEENFFSKYKGTAIFYADPEIYPTMNELEDKIRSCQLALKNRGKTRKHTGKGLVGDTYFGGRLKK
jgi:hypothetical protein